MKNKKWLLLLIIAFPSLFWLILETSTINSRKLPFYGPKTVKSPGDTIFHKVAVPYLELSRSDDTTKKHQGAFVVCFVAEQYREDAYRLTGLWEYQNYKKSKIEHLPVILVTETDKGINKVRTELAKLEEQSNISLVSLEKKEFRAAKAAHFKEKPYYIDYSFFILIDGNRHIRGYYDGRYVSEFKRLLGEYQHLRLKEEKQIIKETNEIKTSN